MDSKYILEVEPTEPTDGLDCIRWSEKNKDELLSSNLSSYVSDWTTYWGKSKEGGYKKDKLNKFEKSLIQM
jgi:hypothetical protein